MIVLNFPKRL